MPPPAVILTNNQHERWKAWYERYVRPLTHQPAPKQWEYHKSHMQRGSRGKAYTDRYDAEARTALRQAIYQHWSATRPQRVRERADECFERKYSCQLAQSNLADLKKQQRDLVVPDWVKTHTKVAPPPGARKLIGRRNIDNPPKGGAAAAERARIGRKWQALKEAIEAAEQHLRFVEAIYTRRCMRLKPPRFISAFDHNAQLAKISRWRTIHRRGIAFDEDELST